jgi:hypothetical protein
VVAPATAPATVAGGATVASPAIPGDSAAQNGGGDQPPTAIRPPASAPFPARSAALRSDPPSATLPPRRPAEPARRSDAGGHRRGWGTVAALVATLVVVGGGAALLVTTLGGSDKPKAPNVPGQVNTGGSGTKPTSNTKNSAVPRGRVVVTVLNGTTVTGLAASVRDKVVAAGFKKGGAFTGPDQTRSATIVQYAPGYSSQARQIGKVLNVDAIERLDASTKAVACPPGQCDIQPNVVVTVGADRTQE